MPSGCDTATLKNKKKTATTSKDVSNTTTRNITKNKDSCGNVLSMNSFKSLHVAPSRVMGAAFALARCCRVILGKENYIDSVNPNDSMQERNEFLRPGRVAITATKIAHKESLMALFMKTQGKLCA